jgi:4-amino-4-deoxy-L-arabinose transferase-like glycosyltransferase
MEPAWDYSTFNQNTNTVPTFVFFSIPVVLSVFGLAIMRNGNDRKRKTGLWIVTVTMLFIAFLATPDLGLIHIPAAAFLLAAAINETRKTAAHGSTGSPRTA